MIAPGTRLGPYEILDAIGAGGMGEVYRGRDTRLDRSVAIKVLPPHLSSNAAFKLRFEREARVISGLNHPNICTLHDIGEQEGLDYLVMELCDGQTLADRLTKGPLPMDQVLRIAIQIAGALDRAHRSGIVHRDLKPGNIMLTRSGAKLLDFGLAKPALGLLSNSEPSSAGPAVANDVTQHKPLTAEGTIVGTIQYMAPEQVEGLEADARSDLFAFGAILYEMVTGRRAFDGKTKASLIVSILDREPQPLSEIQPLTPRSLDRVITTCLAKDPEERWQSAHDLMRELEWIRDGVSSPSLPAASQRRRSRERLAWALAIVLPIVAIAGTWISMRATVRAPKRLVSAIAPPADAQFLVTGDTAGPVTLSPDGRWTAYVAYGKTGPRLWLQSLETGDALGVAGGEKAKFPFWSPDSRSIAFFALGKLMIVDIDGASPRAIADAPDARGGSWGPDGRILFVPHTQTGVFQVSSSGGAAEPVTTLHAPYTTHRWPAFLPDGKRFLYIAASHSSPASPDTAIFLGSIEGEESRKLMASASNGLPYRDYVLYVLSGKLLARRLEDGSLTGDPIPIRDNVLHDPGTWRSIVSVSSTGLLAYHPAGATLGSGLVWMDRSGNELGEIAPRIVSDVAISPDGEKVAMVVGDPRRAVYVYDIERGVEMRLSFVDANTVGPVWTRDSRNVVFQAVTSDEFQLFIKPVDGSSSERMLFRSRSEIRPTDVSPDGSLILLNAGGPSGTVMALPLAGGEPYVVIESPDQEYDARFSPDGRWITYNTTSARTPFLAPFPGPGGKWQITNDVAYTAWWHPNGKEIFYLGGNHVSSVEVSFEGGSVRLGAPKTLFPIEVNTNNSSISMAPDGERFLAVTTQPRGSSGAILVTNWDGGLK
ncbi:MAG TPA: protein kinase [Thermoanaerobaculia bacterium]|nr:protein kinase [Thermoanaerobaculia bacterium]